MDAQYRSWVKDSALDGHRGREQSIPCGFSAFGPNVPGISDRTGRSGGVLHCASPGHRTPAQRVRSPGRAHRDRRRRRAGILRPGTEPSRARSFCIDADSGEMAMLGPPGPGGIVASAISIPLASGSVDVCFSSNVLEHVQDWPAMLAEMVRVTRPGGTVFVSFTNWLSSHGGHETSPWHYLGGNRAAAHYQRRHGVAPKTDSGTACMRYRWPRCCAGPVRPAKPPSSTRYPAICRAGPDRWSGSPCCASSSPGICCWSCGASPRGVDCRDSADTAADAGPGVPW